MNNSRRLRRGRTFTVGVATLILAASGALVASAVTPPPAHNNNTVGLKQVGPIDETNGFPIWYKDTNNVKLELCTDPTDPYCIMGEVQNPGQPVSFPDNFPDEAFWSSAESSIDAGGGDSALLVTAVEAAFANEVPAEGDQVSFGRIRIRAGGLVDNAEYKITHPYGVDTAIAEVGAVKGVNVTEDIGSPHAGRRLRPDAGQPPGTVPEVDRDRRASRLPGRPLGRPHRHRQPVQHQLLPHRGAGGLVHRLDAAVRRRRRSGTRRRPPTTASSPTTSRCRARSPRAWASRRPPPTTPTPAPAT